MSGDTLQLVTATSLTNDLTVHLLDYKIRVPPLNSTEVLISSLTLNHYARPSKHQLCKLYVSHVLSFTFRSFPREIASLKRYMRVFICREHYFSFRVPNKTSMRKKNSPYSG